MDLIPEIIKIAQRYLTLKKLNPGTVDGIAGTKTHTALNKLTDLPKTWTPEKKIVGTVQLFAKHEGLDPGPVDGLWGSRTQTAYDQLRHKLLHPNDCALYRLHVQNKHQFYPFY